MNVEQVDIAIIIRRQFRRRMPLDGDRQLLGTHAVAIVLDHQTRQPAALDAHADRPRTRIQRILNQLLGGGSRTLDNLARRNAVHRRRRQPANASRWRGG